MKIYIMSDLEGVCGVLDHDNWVLKESRYYDEARKLLTLEINAAVEGFCEAGATEIMVVDGHGEGGINQSLLDPRTTLMRGSYGPWPGGLDKTFDAAAWIGQHAKAGTPFAHIAHTQWFNYLDYRINGVSVGEFGQLAFCAASFGVMPILGCGDQAFTDEASALVPGIETVAVKRGLIPGSGDELDCDAYRRRNVAAIHLHPQKSRELIKSAALKALRRYKRSRDSFTLLDAMPPFRVEASFRPDSSRAAYKAFSEHPTELPACMNSQMTPFK